ncbi:MAG TPA: hypothetical protein VK775_05220, partial [Chthoniobacterales bacterium]|nr:hypothetical protein [Chthoniobacterales bacterium]
SFGVFLEATRQHWLTTHVARKEGSDNFKMDWGITHWREIKASRGDLFPQGGYSQPVPPGRSLALASCLHRR